MNTVIKNGRSAALMAALLLWSAAALPAASPVQVSNVSHGTATVTSNGPLTVIHASNQAVINYTRFDIPSGATVQFIQPSALSRVLNRIDSSTPSALDGTLSANGIVYLVNPAGITFGPHSVVNVGQLYAAAGSLSDADFLNGVNHFTALGGAVNNQGLIQAMAVNLVGSQVSNGGNIVAPNGLVAMVAGHDVYVSETGSNISVKVDPAAPLSGGAGLAAGSVYALALSQSGSVQANQVAIAGPTGGLVSVSGKIDASNASGGKTGGSVQISGGEIELVSATVDVSGSAGGGTILIGGSPHGQLPGANGEPNALGSFVSSDSALHADALDNGSGGTVVVWSEDATRSYGSITARGGPRGGNGGWVETSGGYLDVGNPPDTSAAHGLGGTWLLDPTTITIVSTVPGSLDGQTPNFTWAAAGATVSNAAINGALDQGENVTITATADMANNSTGDLVQNADAPIAASAVSGSRTLTMNAGGTMILNGGISTAGTGLTVDLTAANGIQLNSDITAAAGSITCHSPVTIGAAAVTLTAASVTFDSTVDSAAAMNNALDITTTGGVTFDGVVGGNQPLDDMEIDAGGPIDLTDITVTGILGLDSPTGGIGFTTPTGTVTLSAGLALEIGGPIATAADVNLTLDGGEVDLFSNIGIGGNIQCNGPTFLEADVTLAGANVGFSSTLNSAKASHHSLTLNATGQVTIDGDVGAAQSLDNLIVTAPGVIDLTNATVDGNLSLTSAGGIGFTLAPPGVVTWAAGGTVTIDGVVGAAPNLGLTVDAAAIDVNQSIELAGTGNILLNGPVVLTQDVVLTGRDVDLGSTVDSDSALTPRSLTITATNDAIFDGAVGAGEPLNNLNVTGANTVAINGATVTIGGALTLISPAGKITTGGPTAFDAGGAATFDGPFAMQGDVTVTGASVSFASTVDSTGTNHGPFPSALTVTSPGPVTFAGAIGEGEPLSGLTVTGGGLVTVDSGQALVAGAVQITGPQIDLDTNIQATGHNISCIGPVILTQDVTLIGSNISFTSTVDSDSVATPRALTLVQSGNVALDGNIGATAPLSNLTIGAAGTTTLTGDSVTTTVNQTYGNTVDTSSTTLTAGGNVVFAGPLVLGIDNSIVADTLTVSAANVTFDSTIDSATGTEAPPPGFLTVNATGTATFNGDIGDTGPLQSLITGAGTPAVVNAASIATVGNQTYGGPVTVNGTTFVSSQGNITFDQPVTLNTGLVVNAGGAVNIDGAITGNVTGLTAAFTAGTFIDLNADVTVPGPGGGITFNSPVILTADVVVGGDTIGFASTVNSDSALTPRALTVNSTTSVIFDGSVGAVEPLSNLTTAGGMTFINCPSVVTTVNQQYGNTTFTGGTLTAGGSVVFTGTLALGTDMTVTGSSVTFDSTVDSAEGHTGPLSSTLTATSPGPVTFDGVVGGNLPLEALTTGASTPAMINGASVTTIANQTYGGPVTVDGPVNGTTFDSSQGDVTFNGSVTSASGLTVTAGDNVTMAGVDTAVTRNLSLTSTGGDINLSNTITAGGNAVFTGPVLLRGNTAITATAGPVTFSSTIDSGPGGPAALSVTSGGAVTFGGSIGADPPLESLTVSALGLVTFNGPLVEVFGNIDLNLSGATALPTFNGVPEVATLSGPTGGGNPASAMAGDLTFKTDGDFVMGPNQKLTVEGNLTIEGLTGPNAAAATVGDLNALGTLTILADTITFEQRAAGEVEDSKGGLAPDKGVDYVAGAGFVFAPGTTFITSGTGAAPEFADSNGARDGVPAGFEVFSSRIAAADFAFGGVVLDPAAENNASEPNAPDPNAPPFIPPVVADGVPPELRRVREEVVITKALRDRMRELGVYGRDLETDEFIGLLSGHGTFNDVPGSPIPTPEENTVASNRLTYKPILIVAHEYEGLFYKDGKSRKKEIREAIDKAWSAYRSDAGDDATPAGFRTYLRAHPDDPAAGIMDGLQVLMAHIDRLGLTPQEAEISESVLFREIVPKGVKRVEFVAAVRGDAPATRP